MVVEMSGICSEAQQEIFSCFLIYCCWSDEHSSIFTNDSSIFANDSSIFAYDQSIYLAGCTAFSMAFKQSWPALLLSIINAGMRAISSISLPTLVVTSHQCCPLALRGHRIYLMQMAILSEMSFLTRNQPQRVALPISYFKFKYSFSMIQCLSCSQEQEASSSSFLDLDYLRSSFKSEVSEVNLSSSLCAFRSFCLSAYFCLICKWDALPYFCTQTACQFLLYLSKRGLRGRASSMI